MPEFYTVLVVDDDPAVRTAMRQMMERQGYEVHLAQDGPEALEIARAQPPDLILCDYRMPQMDGIEVLKAMSDICPEAIRILVTAHGEIDVAMSAINEAGIYKFVLKPWSPRDLAVMVKRALEHYQLIQEGKALMSMLDMALQEQELKTQGLEDQILRYRQLLGMGIGGRMVN